MNSNLKYFAQGAGVLALPITMLIGCGGGGGSSSTPLPTATSMPQATATSQATFTPNPGQTPAPKPTPTFKPAPTAKPTPTTKPTPIAKPTPTSRPKPTATPVPVVFPPGFEEGDNFTATYSKITAIHIRSPFVPGTGQAGYTNGDNDGQLSMEAEDTQNSFVTLEFDVEQAKKLETGDIFQFHSRDGDFPDIRHLIYRDSQHKQSFVAKTGTLRLDSVVTQRYRGHNFTRVKYSVVSAVMVPYLADSPNNASGGFVVDGTGEIAVRG